MEKKIQLPRGVCEIIEELEARGFEAYAVGGAVRDLCLGRAPGDFDVTTSALPEEVKAVFPRTVDTGIAHGTVTVLRDGTGYEVTTYRIDGKYSDARHPESVEFTRSLAEDLRRRDFTINAMAYNPRTGLVDLFSGREDLSRGLIRAVGVPEERFREDALRIMRCVRFAAQLGFAIEEETLRAAETLSGTLAMISRERIREELLKILLSDHPEHIETLYRIGAFRAFLKEEPSPADVSRTVRILTNLPKDRVLRTAAFLIGLSGPSASDEACTAFAADVLAELKFDNDTRDAVLILASHRTLSEDRSQPAVRRLIAGIGYEGFDRLIALLTAERTADGLSEDDLRELSGSRREIEGRGHCVRMKDMKLTGKDLIAMGVAPGKAMGGLLAELFNEVLKNPALNTPEALTRLAEERLASVK